MLPQATRDQMHERWLFFGSVSAIVISASLKRQHAVLSIISCKLFLLSRGLHGLTWTREPGMSRCSDLCFIQSVRFGSGPVLLPQAPRVFYIKYHVGLSKPGSDQTALVTMEVLSECEAAKLQSCSSKWVVPVVTVSRLLCWIIWHAVSIIKKSITKNWMYCKEDGLHVSGLTEGRKLLTLH